MPTEPTSPAAAAADLALRETWRGRVWRIVPTRVVAHEGDELVVWYPEGTPVLRPFDGAGAQLRIPGDADWRLEPRPAHNAGLGVIHLGGRWALWHHWRGGAFRSWYVNFERDHRLGPGALDYVDEKLDLVVEPDGRWRWKDEDELAAAAAVGYLDAAAVRAAAAEVLARPPWPSGWESFVPDPAWPAPRLPPGWDEP